MAYGRKFLVKPKRRYNYFTFEDYNGVCGDITVANHLTTPNKQVVVTHAKNKGAGVSSVIKEVLKKYNLRPKRDNKYASSNKKWLFVFDTKEDASKAADIINKMAIPDYITESKIKTNGDVTTAYGLKITVDVGTDPSGNVTATQGGGYVSVSKESETQSSSEQRYTKWFLIGGAAFVTLIVIIAFLKKKKIL